MLKRRRNAKGSYYQMGKGKKYYYKTGDLKSRMKARKKAMKGKGFINSLYKKIKSKVNQFRLNPVGAPLGFNYCGPGTKMEGQQPTSKTDGVCKTHDEDYDRITERRKEGLSDAETKKLVREADKKMIDSLDNIKEDGFIKKAGYYLSKYGIKGKMMLENAGLLNPKRFVGNGKKKRKHKKRKH